MNLFIGCSNVPLKISHFCPTAKAWTLGGGGVPRDSIWCSEGLWIEFPGAFEELHFEIRGVDRRQAPGDGKGSDFLLSFPGGRRPPTHTHRNSNKIEVKTIIG